MVNKSFLFVCRKRSSIENLVVRGMITKIKRRGRERVSRQKYSLAYLARSRGFGRLRGAARFSVKGKKPCTRILVGRRITLAPGIFIGCGCYRRHRNFKVDVLRARLPILPVPLTDPRIERSLFPNTRARRLSPRFADQWPVGQLVPRSRETQEDLDARPSREIKKKRKAVGGLPP